jgi:hypothetical protein
MSDGRQADSQPRQESLARPRRLPRPPELKLTDPIPRDDDDDAVRDYLDLAAIFANTVPIFGGAVSHVLGGWSQNRRFQRIREVLQQLEAKLAGVRDAVREDYIRGDEFEDLLDQTLRRVAAERHEAKRRLYGAFLAGAVTSPGEPPYHEQLRFLRALEELQPDHIRILRALQTEDSKRGGLDLSDISRDRIQELMIELHDDFGLLAHTIKLKSTSTGYDVDKIGGRCFTPRGERLIAYMRAAEATAGKRRS